MEPTMLIIAASISLSAHLNVGEDTYRERRICKLDDTIQGACFRPDGRLVAVGSTDGPIMVIDVSTKVVLRKLEGHRAPVKSLVFLPNLVQLVSTSDDRTIRIWDIPTGREVRCISHNSDFVRSCSALEERFATGSYDHTVSIWCPDSPTPCATFDHGDPVEAVCLFPNGKLVASAGCSSVKIWRIDDGILLREITMHHKTISCMHISKDSKYLITGSLDQSVKILRLDDFQIAHQFKFPFAVLCLSVSVIYIPSVF